ncbi:MAG: EAL domain-containing protein [Azonexus sp.]|jgi:EAL domain-containing protein (putative c-di-GMP-specific phosphodiesterase class I)/GGDEF domain-containing protein|nr:EAL domain-containing protein [Azonexus sp.]
MSSYLVELQHNEEARLNALRDLGLLDTPPSESFDRLTRLASRLLGAPVSTISLTDHDRQWFKSKVGVDLAEIPREQAPCNYAIQDSKVFVVPDLKEDERFRDSPLVQAGIRFYAGAPLITRAGYGLGTICVVDVAPRQLEAEQEQALRDLAAMVMSQIELQNMIGRVDSASGLPNLYQLLEDLEGPGDATGTTATGIVIDFMPSDQASYSWRALGAEYGDNVVRDALRLIQRLIGKRGKLYHIDATRSAILLKDDHEIEPAALIEEILAKLREPIWCKGILVALAPVLGSYQFTPGAEAPRTIVRRLFNAVEDAQHADGSVASYDPEADQRATRKFVILNDFKHALEADGQLLLHYQPRIAFASGCRTSAEALLRWNHPALGAISPGEFVPLVERTALARPMTDWVLRGALAQAVAWNRQRQPLAVAINISAANLDEHDFAERVIAAVERSGLTPGCLELEFTESALARNNDCVLRQLLALKEFGAAIFIDDFGAGYSNMSYLQKLPVSAIKIDRSFVYGLEASPRNQKLVRAMIKLSHDLGYRVMAEGIESKAAWDLLASWECDEGQGYYLGRPMPADSLTAILDGGEAPLPGRAIA